MAIKREATVGEIARRLRRSTHQVQYIVRTRQIQPSSVAGILRLFDEDAVERIAAEFDRLDGSRDREEASEWMESQKALA